jgi:hypothetical protein
VSEVDKRTESDGRGLAKYEAGKWVPLLPGVVVRTTPDGIKIEMPH